jgi:glycerol-3-phosphate acyltransferase PlsY
MTNFLVIVGAYLCGSVPYGLILTRLFGGLDVRSIGSGNIGATNVLRTGHKGIAAATLLCDFLKGFLPVYLGKKMGIEELGLLLAAYAAILGHIFPVWLRFQGGKGVATALGVFWALSLPLGIVVTATWALVARLLKTSSLSALVAFAVAPLFAVFVLPWSLTFFCGAVAGLIFWTHRSNIYRLRKGQEQGIGK